MMTRFLKRMLGDRSGATAAEFGLLLPLFLLLTLGTLGATTLGFTAVSLQFATEDAARCAAVKTNVCSNAATTAAYAKTRFQGFQVNPTFTYSTTGCGHTVQATGVMTLNLIPQLKDIALTAKACYP